MKINYKRKTDLKIGDVLVLKKNDNFLYGGFRMVAHNEEDDSYGLICLYEDFPVILEKKYKSCLEIKQAYGDNIESIIDFEDIELTLGGK